MTSGVPLAYHAACIARILSAVGVPERCMRDLAAWMLTAADKGVGGVFNTVSRPGHTTMGGLLTSAVSAVGSDAVLVWAPATVLQEAGVAPWVEMPIWLPRDEEYGGMHDGDVSAAYAAGLTCRPVEETVADTWAWLRAEGDPAPLPGRPRYGLDPAKEQAVLGGLLAGG